VLFDGTYALIKKNQRLSELVQNAGGLTPQAYPEGARLVRQMTDEELQRLEVTVETALQTAKNEEDSINIRNTLANQVSYPVGIELHKALEKPGSAADITLRDGDRLIVPQFSNTVKMSGEVMYANTVAYQKGRRLNYYLDQAGGYGDEAKKSKVYVVYLNGTVARANRLNSGLIKPGCEIVVPKKNKERLKTTEILSLGSTSASLATVIITLTNILRR
jgi:protein involved in polysaccharide export with SLBB domain